MQRVRICRYFGYGYGSGSDLYFELFVSFWVFGENLESVGNQIDQTTAKTTQQNPFSQRASSSLLEDEANLNFGT